MERMGGGWGGSFCRIWTPNPLNRTWRFMGLRKYSYKYLNWGYT